MVAVSACAASGNPLTRECWRSFPSSCDLVELGGHDLTCTEQQVRWRIGGHLGDSLMWLLSPPALSGLSTLPSLTSLMGGFLRLQLDFGVQVSFRKQ